jgi:hypothetical protein
MDTSNYAVEVCNHLNDKYNLVQGTLNPEAALAEAFYNLENLN